MAYNIRSQLMFDGTAQEAVNLYVDLFPDSQIVGMETYTEGKNAGKVVHAMFVLNGVYFTAIDSPVKQDFGFTPAMSIFVDCESAEEIDAVFAKLSDGGEILMPMDNYGFSKKFAWLNDRFGVSWQLNLPEARE